MSKKKSDNEHYGVIVRFYPNEKQKNQIQKTFGCKRFVYNKMLDKRSKGWKRRSDKLNFKEQKQFLSLIKSKFTWLKEVDKFALENAVFDLQSAYENFFDKRANYPRFKNKHKSKQSYKTNETNGNIEVSDDSKGIKLPKLGWMNCSGSEKVLKKAKKKHRISSATITFKAGIYTCSILFEKKPVKVVHASEKAIAVDVGITHFYTDSNGNKVENPRFYVKTQEKLAKEQRKLAKKQKGSHRYNKQKNKIAKIHTKITNQRKNLQHVHSKKLTDENQIVCLENLNIKGMVKNKRLAKHIQDAAWFQFRTFLTYKAKKKGGQVVSVNRWFASSKICSHCGEKNSLLNLSDREWICGKCQTKHDRDENAALNILEEGLKSFLL